MGCFLINFEFMWCYVFILWFYLSFWGVCESGRAEGSGCCDTANSDLLLCGFHKERLYYCVLSFFHPLWAIEKDSRMIICVLHI